MTSNSAAPDVLYQKATLILPCSDKKAAERHLAYYLYQGKGYLQLVKQWPITQIEGAFNLLFLSAEHGLIRHNQLLEPYDQKMTAAQQDKLLCCPSLQNKAKRILRECEPASPLYIALPKLYQKVFQLLAGKTFERFDSVVCVSGGIGSQRGQLSTWLRQEVSRHTDWCLREEAELITHLKGCRPVLICIRIGDSFRPWLSGCGSDAKYGAPVTIKAIFSERGLIEIVDSAGGRWGSFSLTNGLPSGIKQSMEIELNGRAQSDRWERFELRDL
ncbi:hypothetical protein K0504_09855 [Neiella marina]|uniref:DUF6884 domain-containing protein n=1 Tax=Neiella holothuriorum TaxID=2870530 RepID=A0ABS7EG79_9GAMM|nr:DUF6884 domain-containing protein [Neiella holothuriorum]MBW8191341.1 hypothetical protein [Neiella holothuriorum]